MKKIFLSVIVVLSTLTTLAQLPAHRTCGTMDYHNYLMQTRKNYATDYTQYNQMIDRYIQNNQSSLNTAARTANITIPVVIHVVYNTAAQNISDAQATSQFAVLNNDFQRLNADKVNTPSTFTAVAGGVGITFCLAQRDPNGNATTGIIHKSTTTTSFTTDNKIKSSATGGDDPWDVTKYINIWIGNISGGILGYGEFPTGTLSNTYGLVLNYTATGTMGTAASPYNLGRTGTHEFGHCFNLNHIWGDNGQCGASDNCYDTPPQKGQSTNTPYGCNYGSPTYPLYPNTCTRPDGIGGASMTNTNGDMFMNYMDYTDDAAMNMFTQQQCVRMLAVVSNPPWNVLASSNGCTPATSYSLDAGIASILNPVNGSSICNNAVTPSVVLTNAGSTTLTSAKVLYKMDAAATQTLNWTGSLATGSNATLTLNPYTGLASAAHTFSVWVTAPNGGTDQGSTNDSQASTFTVSAPATGAALPFVEGFESTTFPPTGWVLQKANTISATNTWSRLANTTGLTAGSTAIAQMDNFSGNTNIAGQLDALRSPALTFTAANTSLNLSFDVAHRIYSTTQTDTLNVYISSDCGSTWTRLYSKGGTQLANSTTAQTTVFTPTANTQWRRESVSLSAYAGLPSVYVKFESRSGYGNNVDLDNINISYTTATVPVASFSVSSSKCVGSPITFTDLSTNTPTSWTWNFSGGSPSTSTVQNPSVTYTASGIYTITLTSANSSGTSTAVSQTISVIAKPIVAASSSSVCAGNSATLTASGATTYSWSTGATTLTISVAPSITSSYTVTGTAASGCTNTAVSTVTVNAIPVVVSTSATACSGSSAIITASGANTYVWNTGANTASIVASPTVSTTYTVTGTSAAGCVKSATTSILVGITPTVTATSNSICAGGTKVLTASGATTYSWSTGATTPTISVTPSATSSYTVIGTAASGCTNSAVGTITVNALPAIVATSATVCSGSSATIAASGANTYVWNTGATTASLVASPTVNTSYTVTGTSVVGCVKSATTTISVGTTPTVTATSVSVCAGNSATLIATGASSYSWNTGSTTASIIVTPTASITFSVIGVAISGCTNTAVGTVSVVSLPSVSVNSASVCAGGSKVLTASGASTYSWSTGATTTTISIAPTVTSSYTVTGTASNGCKNSAIGTVTVNALPSVLASTATACSGSSATITASGANTYAWNTGATTANLVVNPTSNTVYTVTGTSVAGCVKSVTTTVLVGSIPNVVATSATICAGNTVTLVASGAATYLWSTGSTSANLSDNPLTNTSYTVTGTSTVGCTNSVISTITVKNLPIVTATSASICSGGSAMLNASGAISYTWNTSQNTTTITVAPSITSTYVVTGLGTNGCVNYAMATVTVNALPNVSVTSATICAGTSGTLIASGANTYIWNNGVTGSSLTDSPSSTTTYTVAGASIQGCNNYAIGTIVVTNAPTITINSATICAGETATLTANGVTTYTWDSGSNGSSIMVNPSSTTVFTVNGNLTGCVTQASNTATVTVNSLPVVSLMTVNSLCTSSSPVNLMGSPTNGTYTGVGVSGSMFDPSLSGSGTFTVMYYYTDLNGCSNHASQPVSVNICTGIADFNALSEVLVFPNPTSDVIYINFNGVSFSNVEIELYDALGQLVIKNKVVNAYTGISVQTLPVGIYTIKITSNTQQLIKRIIKN